MRTKLITQRIAEFAGDENANVTIEFIFMFPMLVWTYVAGFAFFDAFKAQNTNLTAAYTISDMLSREVPAHSNDGIDDDYLNGLNAVFDFLTTSPDPTWIRVSSIKWDADEDEFQVAWSRATGGHDAWTTETLQNVADQIPAMGDQNYAILVETNMTYNPIFGIELAPMTFENFVVTSPRFSPMLCFEGEPCVAS